MRALLTAGLLVAGLVASCARSAGPSWSDARAMWDTRRPHAWAAWSAIAARPEGPDGMDARSRLAEASRTYEEGVRALEHGEPSATTLLRHGAEIAPIDPLLYLRLARACRAQGALVRSADFYRKLLVEDSQPDVRATATAELSQIDHEMGDPFVPAVEPPDRRVALGAALLLGVATVLLLRGRRVDVARVLGEHPERAAAFAYQVGVLRHELFKHRLAPWRIGRVPEAMEPPERVWRVWRRHLEVIGVTLGLGSGWARRETHFASADRAIRSLGIGSSLMAVDVLDRLLVEWVRLSRHTRVDGALLEAIAQSVRDERPTGLATIELEVKAPMDAPIAAIFEHDLLLVARNLLRNAVAAAQDGRVLVAVTTFVDDVGRDWVRLAVHDSSASRPDARASADRGLGIVRATLERYGGALLESAPARGYAKALVASVPMAEECTAEAEQHGRLAA